MDRYEVMAGKMAPLTDGAHRKNGDSPERSRQGAMSGWSMHSLTLLRPETA